MDAPLARETVLTAKAIRARFEAALGDHGAGLPTWVVLDHLVSEPGLSQRGLASRLEIEGATLTRHLERLEREGLVARRRDERDRRIIRVEATPAGRSLHRRLRAAAARFNDRLVAGVPARDLAAFRRVLATIRHNLEEADARAS